MKSRALIAIFACLVWVCAGCAVRTPPTAHDYYAQGQLLFADGEYHAAIENYQHLIDQFPFDPHAEDAELKIALAHYKMGEYAETIGALQDFQSMHPTSKNLALASYYLAMSYFKRIGHADQDQTNTRAALRQFEILEQRFPETAFSALAHDQAAICREMLSRNELVIGNYYYKRANYRAAESRLAELMQLYPNSPVAPDALHELAVTLEKEGKKYSAAEAFTALELHFPHTSYSADAQKQLAKLHQPVGTEADPLQMVLAESGFSPDAAKPGQGVIVRQADAAGAGSDGLYGTDGLPDLNRAAAQAPAPPAPVATAAETGPALLKNIRLSSTDPPLSVILDLSRSVKYEKQFQSGAGYATLVVVLKQVAPAPGMRRHIVFNNSIFRDCDVTSDAHGTVVTLNTNAVQNYAVIPLEEPARLLLTFTPVASAQAAPGGF